MFAQRDFVYALEEELRISSKPLKYKVKETRAEGSGLFRVFIDPFAYGARGLDESLIVVLFPLGGNDCLDSPHCKLRSGRKLIAGVLRPITMNAEERHLKMGSALELAF